MQWPDDFDVSREFPILDELTFFNHAGVAPISGRAAAALRKFAELASKQAYFNSGFYAEAKRGKQLLAKMINARGPHEIAYVANTSTGVHMVAKGIRWEPGDNVVISNVEYPANRYPWEDLKGRGVELREVRQRDDGRIAVGDVIDLISDHTRVVSLSHVQYASGFRIELKEIADMVHRAGGFLCVDAIQSVGVLPVDVQAMSIDFLTADGHKWLLGPEGCGFFYCDEQRFFDLHPAVVGWMNMVDASNYGDYNFEFAPDARRFEPGSYNIPGIWALAASAELLLEVGIESVWSRVYGLTSRLCEGLAKKGYQVVSPRNDEVECSGIVIFESANGDKPPAASVVSELEKQGIVIVVREGRLRASVHFYNTEAQVDRLVEAIP